MNSKEEGKLFRLLPEFCPRIRTQHNLMDGEIDASADLSHYGEVCPHHSWGRGMGGSTCPLFYLANHPPLSHTGNFLLKTGQEHIKGMTGAMVSVFFLAVIYHIIKIALIRTYAVISTNTLLSSSILLKFYFIWRLFKEHYDEVISKMTKLNVTFFPIRSSSRQKCT